MFLVLVVHADFWAIGTPTSTDIHNNVLDVIIRVFIEVFSIGCVDIFILISGWFGIHPKKKSFFKLLFQCLFFLIGIYIIALITGYSSLSFKGMIECVAGTKQNWFIKAYILLYILSPILNSFVENTSRKTFKYLLVYFFLFEFIYGWIFVSSTAYIANGYSTVSFIGLYLLARYYNIYKPYSSYFSNLSFKKTLIIVLLTCSIITFLYIAPSYLLNINTTFLGGHFISYISPLTILLSLLILISFSKINMNNQFINWLGASSFAVYLLHSNPNINYRFKEYIQCIYQTSGNCALFKIFLFLLFIFFSAILIDQIRIALWNFICSHKGNLFRVK